MAKKRTEGVNVSEQDTLAIDIANTLNKEGVSTYFIGSDDTPTDLTDFVSTGASLLDIAISNRINGGIACGRITELSGLEGSGKSLIAAHMMANVQKEGGVAVLIDTETAVNEEFFSAIGIDTKKLPYVHTNCVETIFETIEAIVTKVREASGPASQKKVIIVVDSIAQAATKRELEGGFDKDGYGTDKAYLISKALRKITDMIGKQKVALVFTNQLRYKMNAQPFADPYTTPGGKALPFAASIRVRLSQSGQIKNKDGNVVGVKVNAKVVKNRLGPPLRSVTFDMYFDRGIDDVASWLSYLKDKGIVEGTNGNFTYYQLETGDEFKFKTGTWREFTEKNPAIFKEIYSRMAESMIMSYKSDDISTADGSAEVISASDGVNDNVTAD